MWDGNICLAPCTTSTLSALCFEAIEKKQGEMRRRMIRSKLRFSTLISSVVELKRFVGAFRTCFTTLYILNIIGKSCSVNLLYRENPTDKKENIYQKLSQLSHRRQCSRVFRASTFGPPGTDSSMQGLSFPKSILLFAEEECKVAHSIQCVWMLFQELLISNIKSASPLKASDSVKRKKQLWLTLPPSCKSRPSIARRKNRSASFILLRFFSWYFYIYHQAWSQQR